MTAMILVATPHAAFGELLRISLVDSGQYRVQLVHTAKEARAAAGMPPEQTAFNLAIFDAALGDEPFIPLCMDVLAQQPGIRLVVIPPDNNANHPALGGLIPHGYLSRPFYLPDLLDTVSRLLADREKLFQARANPAVQAPAAVQGEAIPPWLQEPLSLHNCLEKELTATKAVAAIAGIYTPGDTGKGTLRANAGSLNDKAAQELVEVVFRYWNSAEKTDLMRFVRLNEDKKDYLVYATQITGDLVLILTFDTSAPLSQIRPQTKAMAQSLASLAPENYHAPYPVDAEPSWQENAGEHSDGYQPDSEPETQPLDDNLLYNRMASSFASHDGSPAAAQSAQDGVWGGAAQQDTPENAEAPVESNVSERYHEPAQDDEESMDGGIINLSALLGSVPSPDPDSADRRRPLYGTDWFQDRSAGSPIPTLSGGLNGGPSTNNSPAPMWEPLDENNQGNAGGETTAGAPYLAEALDESSSIIDQTPKMKTARTAPLDPQTIPRDALPPVPAQPVDYSLPVNDSPMDIDEAEFLQAVSGRPAGLEVKTEPPVTPPGVPAAIEPRPTSPITELSDVEEQPVSSVEETHPHVVSTITSLGQLEPSSSTLSLLNYTCVLVPRLPQHYLTGELADRMAGWVQQLCLAFGWRLEGISIRPEYLQWTVQVAPAISPGNLVRIVRQRTSLHIFGSYPHLADQNPSGDFWATGYLIVSGTQPPSAQLLRDYIAQTRKRQGVSKG